MESPVDSTLPSSSIQHNVEAACETDSSYRSRIKELTVSINQLKIELEECKAKLKISSDNLRYWKGKHLDQSVANLPKSCYYPKHRKKLVEHIRHVLESRTKNMEPTSRAAGLFFRDVAQLCLDKTVHSGLLFENSYAVFRNYVRNFVFTPYNILKKMDLTGGRLNFSGIKLLRSVESNDVPRVWTLLPSTSAMQECATKIEQFGQLIFPYKLMRNKEDGSEGFSFRASDVMSGILVAGGCLYSDARWRPIRLSQSLDGALLFTKNLSHTLGGLKFNDESNSLAQSRNSVWPIVCVCRPESKGLVRSVFHNMIQEIREGALTVLPTKFGVWPLQICTNCDMSCEWKLLGRGGAAQQATFPCSKCTVKSGELHLSAEEDKVKSCLLCKKLGHQEKPDWVCYHHKMCTSEHLSHLDEEVKLFAKIMSEIRKNLTKIWADSKLTMKVNPRTVPSVQQKKDIECIHFDLSLASATQRQEYARSLTNNLVVRKLDVTGVLEERQLRLKKSHIREWQYYQADQVLQNYKGSIQSTAMVYLLDTVPCILHMENRMGLKILTMLLKKGLSNAINSDLPWIPDDSNEGERCLEFIRTVNRIMSLQILGTVDLPTHWKVPYDESKKK